MTWFVTDGEIGCVAGGLAFHQPEGTSSHTCVVLCCVGVSECFTVLAAAVEFN